MELFGKTREMRNAAKQLEKALQSRSDLDPFAADRIRGVTERLKSVNSSSSPQVLDDLEREVDDLNALFTSDPHGADSGGRTGGTMASMERERLQQEAGRIAERLRDRTARGPDAREQAQLAARFAEIRGQMDRLPTGEVPINLYAWRHGVQDLDAYYNKLSTPTAEQQADYRRLKSEMGAHVGEAQRRFETNYRDTTRTALTQARLTRQQVERELLNGIENEKGVTRDDVNKFATGWKYWQRFWTQTAGGALGAIGGGAVAAKVLPFAAMATGDAATGGAVTGSYFILKALARAGMVAGGATIGATLFRYTPRAFNSRSRRSARAEEAYDRKEGIMKKQEDFERLELALRQNVANEAARVQQMSQLLQKEFGGNTKSAMRAIGQISRRAAAGSLIASIGAAVAAVYANPTILSPSKVAAKWKNVGAGSLLQMEKWTDTAIAVIPEDVKKGFMKFSRGILWLLARGKLHMP